MAAHTTQTWSETHVPDNGADDSHIDASQMDTPAHPVPSMQGAFEESILESTEESDMPAAPVEVDAHARRHRLLEAKKYDDSWIARWNQRSTAQYHPLLKLMAQIVFGMHLLQQQQAKSDKEVVKILQTHVNEVDTFLERTAEDFSVAIRDAEDRIRCLRLPMTHIDVFETMLGDQRFRSQLLTGNDKIERIIERTKRAMNAYLLDVEVGVQATRDLHRFMKKIQDQWPQEQRAIADVFGAMRGNELGWKRYLKDLQHKGTVLGGLLASLQKLIDEMSKMAADARTKSKIQSATATATAIEPTPAPSTPSTQANASPDPASTNPTTSSSPHSPQRRTSNLNKPLPMQPAAAPTTATTTSNPSRSHAVPVTDRYERAQQFPPEPSSPHHIPATPHNNILHPRPKTAGEAHASSRQARAADARVKPAEELVNLLQRPDPLRSNPNPLRSNPPDESDVSRTSADTNKLSPSTSGATNLIVGTVGWNQDGAKVTRSVDVMSVATNSVDLARTSSGYLDATRSLQTADGKVNSTANAAVAAENAERRAAMKNTGFARRLSKRLKHLPVDGNPPPSPTRSTAPPGLTSSYSVAPQPNPQFLPRTSSRQPPSPPDSAYASIKSNKTPSSIQPVKPRPISGLGPLPFENQVLNSLRTAKPTESGHADGASVDALRVGSVSTKVEVRSMSSNKSRGSAIKSLFRSKWKASKEVAA